MGAIGRDGRLVDAAHMRLAENVLHKASLSGPAAPGLLTKVYCRKAQLAADLAFMANVDPKHYSNQNGPSTNAEGRITLPALIPGASYRVSDYSTMNVENKGVQVRKDFTVRPGEISDLGDILIEKPG